MKTLTQKQILKFHKIVWEEVLRVYKNAQKNEIPIEISGTKADVLSGLGIEDCLMVGNCLCCECAYHARTGGIIFVDCNLCPLDLKLLCDKYQTLKRYSVPSEHKIDLVEKILNAEINMYGKKKYQISDELHKLVMEVIK